MKTHSLPTFMALSALTTALAVGAYQHASRVAALELSLHTLQGELALANAQAIDPRRIEDILRHLRPPHATLAAAPEQWIYGAAAARYTLVEMTDTECPYCRDHFPLLKALIESSAGQINAALLHVPALGEASRNQALAIECAGEQGGSDAAWKYAQLVFDRTTGYGKGVAQSLVGLAVSLGLEGKRFALCTESREVKARIAADLDQAIRLGIQQTPSTLVLDNATGTSLVLQGANASPEGILKAIASLGQSGGAQ